MLMIPTCMSPAQNFLLIPNHISNLTYSKQISWTFFHNLLLPYSSPVQSGANSSFQLLRPKTLKPFLDSSLSLIPYNQPVRKFYVQLSNFIKNPTTSNYLLWHCYGSSHPNLSSGLLLEPPAGLPASTEDSLQSSQGDC